MVKCSMEVIHCETILMIILKWENDESHQKWWTLHSMMVQRILITMWITWEAPCSMCVRYESITFATSEHLGSLAFVYKTEVNVDFNNYNSWNTILMSNTIIVWLWLRQKTLSRTTQIKYNSFWELFSLIRSGMWCATVVEYIQE